MHFWKLQSNLDQLHGCVHPCGSEFSSRHPPWVVSRTKLRVLRVPSYPRVLRGVPRTNFQYPPLINTTELLLTNNSRYTFHSSIGLVCQEMKGLFHLWKEIRLLKEKLIPSSPTACRVNITNWSLLPWRVYQLYKHQFAPQLFIWPMSNIMATFSFHPVVFSQDPTGNFFAAEPLCDT